MLVVIAVFSLRFPVRAWRIALTCSVGVGVIVPYRCRLVGMGIGSVFFAVMTGTVVGAVFMGSA